MASRNSTSRCRGDCIDCKACVAVCPTGIDIRDGAQLECIQCALCIDACNGIMDKIGRPGGLIAYDTAARKESTTAGVAHEPPRLIRARTVLYAGLLALVGSVMLVAWMSRSVLELNVIADRNPPFVRMSNGGVRNAYTTKILSKLHEPREFMLSARDLPGASLAILGVDNSAAARIRVGTDVLREVRVFVTVPADQLTGSGGPSRRFQLVVRDLGSGTEAARAVTFRGPSTIGVQQP